IRRLLRPGLGNFHIALFENDLSALVTDDGRAKLPFDLVKRIDALFRKEAGKRQSLHRDRIFRLGAWPFRLDDCFGRGWCIRPPWALSCLLAGTGVLKGSAFLHVPSNFDSGALPRISIAFCPESDLDVERIRVRAGQVTR